MSNTQKSTITPVEPTVLIEGQPAVITGRSADDNHPAVVSGEPTVLIAGHPAAILNGQAVAESRSVSGKPSVLVASRPATEN